MSQLDNLTFMLNEIFKGIIFEYFPKWMNTKIEDLVKMKKRLLFMFSDWDGDWPERGGSIWVNLGNSFLVNTWANQDKMGPMMAFNKLQVEKFKFEFDQSSTKINPRNEKCDFNFLDSSMFSLKLNILIQSFELFRRYLCHSLFLSV